MTQRKRLYSLLIEDSFLIFITAPQYKLLSTSRSLWIYIERIFLCCPCDFAYYSAKYKKEKCVCVCIMCSGYLFLKGKNWKHMAWAYGDERREGGGGRERANAHRRSISALSGGFTVQVWSHQSHGCAPKTTLCLAAICTPVHTNWSLTRCLSFLPKVTSLVTGPWALLLFTFKIAAKSNVTLCKWIFPAHQEEEDR